ncbi:hypothetical protein [Novosphingobium sp. KN65.2]|uniref:hypothetical protein n=1 Tax=Novosphingobium sp. KN65.2 TaxID=1478134 RepID=UPI0005E2998C|nr:hypothetical protein [Novosphingobium sp. KN65.2]CDO35155.1 conserved hypothetical protein [Novosphingobium sp. KN65.2]
MNARFIKWIWHIKGSLPLAPEQSSDETFGRLAPLFQQNGTSYDMRNDTLTFSKKDQAAQDKMSVFDGGILRIERGEAGPVLRYHLVSRALLFCFLAPLLFLSFAQLTIVVGKLEKPSTEATDKKFEKQDKALPQHPLDKALGAPAPEKPGKDAIDSEGKKPSPTSAYVFAAIFAVLYLVGRVLEAGLIKSLFKNKLLGN